MKQAKELFINSVRQIRIQGDTVIPTVVLYKDGKSHAGIDALENCEETSVLREDFKIEIGNDDPIKLAQKHSGTGTSSRRSILGIAKDFCDYVVGQGLSAIERQGFQHPSRILIAEPLALANSQGTHDEWLKNYRQSLRRIMSGKFTEVDFMPEPFAVFQYYRYGIRHALVAQRQKHIALVIDFGGGTFDTSIIETTVAGDISQSGRNSRPLAARSIPIGGFYINRMIAETLLFRTLDKGMDKPSVRRAIDAFPNMKNMDDEELALQRSDYAAFTRNFHRLLQSVEQAKCTVCNGVTNWRLDVNLASSAACPVQVPQRPMQTSSASVPIRLEAADLRTLYEERIWKQNLLPSIRETLKRAESEVGGKPISIVLLSGGSSNIRWLKPLIERDLAQALRHSEILELSENFQEIVAKGLAVECARRFYTEGDGDFRAVTYNRLCLGLDSNGRGLELKKFTPESGELEGIEPDAGVLLPSATSLKGLIGRPLRWKVRPQNLPTRTLDYYFMRSSFDPDEVGSRQNLDTRIQTPAGTSLGRTIGIELMVREDGTADPSFVYGHGSQSEHNTVIRGRPFFLDMTFAAEDTGGETYLGFDFGTSTSSLCYVNGGDIRTYADRANDQTWLGLSALIDVLPYPAAYPLARFFSETSSDQMERWGREAFEGMLTLAAYLAYSEHCALGGGGGAFFKTFRQRSAGPLWAMLKNCASASGSRWEFCRELLPLLANPILDEVGTAVSQVAQTKHGKRAENLDYPRLLEKVGNILAKTFNGKVLGFFEEVRLKPFSRRDFQGIFRSARGALATFIDVYEYEGTENFPAEFVFVFDITKEIGLPMFPLFVRGLDKDRPNFVESEFFMYDIVRAGGNDIAFRAVQERDEVILSTKGAFVDLYEVVVTLLRSDPEVAAVRGIRLRARSSD